MNKAIIVEGLGKEYQIGHKKSGNLRDSLMNVMTFSRKRNETFWAIKDLDFSVNKGDALGIIGRNGAGKSTLLKLLSRITSPTEGGFTLSGRVSSLLEVGTGFHPELTGRENIFLNGTILGMKRVEVKNKFDEIVAFSGIEKFIDTPVKRYSSGMYVRLAFAVAAHLEPEILIVDEVLAVGDAEFQKKCLGKMKEVSENQGRTVLFVSHDLRAIQKFCNKSVLLDKGRLIEFNDTGKIISQYLKNINSSEAHSFEYSNGLKITGISSVLEENNLKLIIKLNSDTSCKFSVDIRLKDAQLTPIGFISFKTFSDGSFLNINPGQLELNVSLSTENLAIGEYYISIDLTNPNVEYFDRKEEIVAFEVLPLNTTSMKFLEQSWNYGSIQLKGSIQLNEK